jgi:hypothetical protein
MARLVAGVPVSLSRVARPASSTVIWSLVGAGAGGLGIVLALLMGLTPPSSASSGLGLGLFGASFFGGGPLMIGLTIAGAQEPRPFPRGVVWIAAGLVSMVAAVLLAAGMGLDEGVATGLGGGVLCCGLPTAALLGSGCWSILTAFRTLEQTIDQAAMTELVSLLGERRAATFDELAEAVDLPAERIEPLLRKVEARIGGELNLAARTWVSGNLSRTGRPQLLGIIEARGKVTESELSAGVGVPSAVVRAWIYELAGSGDFEGTVHWPDVWSASAARLGTGQCPNCGGAMNPAGRNRLQCAQCGSEGFA